MTNSHQRTTMRINVLFIILFFERENWMLNWLTMKLRNCRISDNSKILFRNRVFFYMWEELIYVQKYKFVTMQWLNVINFFYSYQTPSHDRRDCTYVCVVNDSWKITFLFPFRSVHHEAKKIESVDRPSKWCGNDE